MLPAPFEKRNRSAYLNFLRAQYEMYTGQTRVTSYPYYLLLEPSDVCQLRCPTCITGIENETRRRKDEPVIFRRKRSMLTASLLEGLLEEMGEYLFVILFYNFGEPLLNKNLPDLVRRARRYDIEIQIHTNLSLPLSDAEIDELLTSGVGCLQASIDGFSQETYQVHRVGGNLRLVKDNLERLARARDRLGLNVTLGYNFLVFRHNEHEIPAARAYCDDLGIEFVAREAFIHDPTWLPSHRQDEEPSVVPDEVALPPAFSHRREGKVLSWSPLSQLPVSEHPPGCSWHYGYSVISAGGAVSPCCAALGDQYDFGTVTRERGARFADVWNNELYQVSRAAFAGKESPAGPSTLCTRCPMPPLVHHLYSLQDCRVLGQFHRLWRGTDSVLEEAFDSFSRTRFRASLEQLFPGGVFREPQVPALAPLDEREKARFVAFFERHLLHDGWRGRSAVESAVPKSPTA